MNKNTALTLAHFGIGASYVIATGAAALNVIPIWGALAATVLGASAHVVAHTVANTVRKNVDPDFDPNDPMTK